MTPNEQDHLILSQVQAIGKLQDKLVSCRRSLRSCQREVMSEVMGLYAHLEIISSQLDNLFKDS